MTVKIVIVDDHAMVREGFKQLLSLDASFEVVGEASDGYECLNLVNKTNPDVILLDINMPNLDGLQTLRIMRQQNMNNKVIMLTIHNDVDYVIKAMSYQCNGYVVKDSDFDTLKNAILAVNEGEIFVEPKLTVSLNSSLAKRDTKQDVISELTKRELDVLILLSSGMLNKEIAYKLNISERTVKNHISSMFKKIGVSDRTQAAVFAIKNNIISIK
ncbi:MAG: response regulator [Lachnospira sp.]